MTPAIVVAGGTHLDFVNWCNEHRIAPHSPLVLHVRYRQRITALALSRTSTLVVSLDGDDELVDFINHRRRLP